MYYHQALINLLYSLQKLKNGNEDVQFFDDFLTGRLSFDQFVAFLNFREIFQSVTKITIMGSSDINIDKDKLLVDPTRILISREVAAEMAAIYERAESEIGGEVSEHTFAHFQDKVNEGYYLLMAFLISIPVCKEEDQIARLCHIFQPEEKRDWDYNIGFPKNQDQSKGKTNRGSPSAQSKLGASERRENKPDRSAPISSFNQGGDKIKPTEGAIPEAKEEGDHDEYRLSTTEIRGKKPEEGTSPSRAINSQAGQSALDKSRGAKQVVSQVEFGKQGESELNLMLRRKMSQLIVKFLDAVVDEDPKIENKTQSKTKLHAIVNRKCQNLLTSVFSTEKNQFQKLLMMRIDSTKDALAVDEIFDRYDIIRKEGMENLGEKRANDFLKGMLKMDKLASHISNLIMYSTTPLEEIVRYR